MLRQAQHDGHLGKQAKKAFSTQRCTYYSLLGFSQLTPETFLIKEAPGAAELIIKKSKTNGYVLLLLQ
jgi:hypothetical protein